MIIEKKVISPERDIMKIINEPLSSVKIFDFDGVLCKYEFGERNALPCYLNEVEGVLRYIDVYSNAKPIKPIIDFINKNNTSCYVCISTCTTIAKDQKAFLKKYINYNCPKFEEYHTFSLDIVENSMEIVDNIKKNHPLKGTIKPKDFIFISADINKLNKIQLHDFSTCHVSSFFD